MKKYFQAVEAYSASPSDELKQAVQSCQSEAYSKIDKAVKRGVYHKNNAARKKARLARAFSKATQPQASQDEWGEREAWGEGEAWGEQ